WQQNSNWPLTF
nr:immunoglobulin light chain junction region [Macaca mulatta]